MKRVFLLLLLVVTTTTFAQESLQKIDTAIATEKSVRYNLFFVRPQLSLPIVSSHSEYLFEPRVVFGYQFGSQLSIGLGTGVIDKFIMDGNFDIIQALYSVPLCFSVRTYFNDGLWSPFAELSGGYCFGINSRIEHVVLSDVDYYNNTLIM